MFNLILFSKVDFWSRGLSISEIAYAISTHFPSNENLGVRDSRIRDFLAHQNRRSSFRGQLQQPKMYYLWIGTAIHVSTSRIVLLYEEKEEGGWVTEE